ncbi:MAG: DMT family transporter [Rhabdaerophilum calidifontis]
MRGIIAMMAAMGFFVINDTLVKLVRQHWDTGQIIVVRGVFALVLLFGWVALAGQLGRIQAILRPDLATRGLIEAVVAASFITALGMMPLADITAILLAAPLLITALSMVLFGEAVGWRRWSAVAVGFLGMLLVVRPGGNAAPPLALGLALVSVLGVALRDLMTRRVPTDIPSVIVAVTSTLGTLAAGLALMAGGGAWHALAWEPVLILAAAAAFVLAGNYAVIEACRDVELSVVSPFRYVVIVWAVLLGILVFGDWPAPVALGGIALIVASGLYTLHRERIRGQLK